MKCSSCSIEISKEFKAALAANKCPACGKPILATGNMSAFIPLYDIILKFKGSGAGPEGGGWYESDIEDLTTQILSSFNVRLKSDKEEAPQTKTVEAGSDEEHKQKQMVDAKTRLQQLREEAMNEAIAAQWGLDAPGEEPLDPDIGESLANKMPDTEANAGQVLLDQKREQARQNMLNGTAGKGGFRRS